MATRKKTNKAKPAGKTGTKKTSAKKASAKTKSAAKKRVTAKKAPVKKTAAKKKPAAKKPVAKKTAAKKPAAKKQVTVKKPAPAKKKVAAKAKAPAKKKVPAKKKPVAAKKSAAKKSARPKAKATSTRKSAVKSATKPLPVPAIERKPLLEGPAAVKSGAKRGKVKKLTARELKKYRQALLNLRDQVVDGIAFLAGDNLNRSQRDASGDLSGYSLHMADQGTDNYDREFALNLVSSEQDILYEIDEAIRRVDKGTYGICELTGEPIERARLDVLPYARNSVAAQSELEKGKKRYRPFGPTLVH